MNRKQRRARPTKGETPFAAALRHQQDGRLSEAAALYRQVLAANPRHADSLNLLGVVTYRLGGAHAGADMVRQAIVLAPDVAAYHSNLGNMLTGLGRLEEAAASLRRAIALAPALAEAHNNLGCVLRLQGSLEEALPHLHRALAIQQRYPEAKRNLGVALAELGRMDEAVQCLRGAIALRPDAPAHHTLGCVFLKLGQFAESAACFRRVLALDPAFPGGHSHLGAALAQQGHLEEAIASFRQAIVQRPASPEAQYDMGTALKQAGLLEEAAERFRHSLSLRPDSRDTHNNLGSTLTELGDAPAAEACFRAALCLDPGFVDGHTNLGVVLREQGRLEEGLSCFRQALALDPACADAHFYQGMALLAKGDLDAGWPEYEWRWQTAQLLPTRRDFAQPRWHGEADAGTLLIHAEQGFGDSLQFCRYATMAARRGLRVILEVPSALARLLRTVPGVAAVSAAGAALPPFDVHCPMLSLPLALGTTVATIPAETYLFADPAQAAAWRSRLDAMARPGPRVGLVWAGNPRSWIPALAAVDRRRSVMPERLAPLLAIPGVHFISLQKDGTPPPADWRLTDAMAEMGDFADTAALVANLDLVIAVDTSVAHLAGGMGRPVWLLDRFDSCWRWLTGRRDSPWYPSLRLYRQTAPGDWDPVIAEVARDLRALAG